MYIEMVITAVGKPVESNPKRNIQDIVDETDQQLEQSIKGLLGENYYGKRKRSSKKTKKPSKKTKKQKPTTLFEALISQNLLKKIQRNAMEKLAKGSTRRKSKKKSTQKKKRSTQGKKGRSKRTLRRR